MSVPLSGGGGEDGGDEDGSDDDDDDVSTEGAEPEKTNVHYGLDGDITGIRGRRPL